MRQQFRSFAQQCLPALTALVVLTVLCGLVFPLAVTGVAQAAFRDRADGSLIERNGEVVGSSLIGQQFSAPEYFHPDRPPRVPATTALPRAGRTWADQPRLPGHGRRADRGRPPHQPAVTRGRRARGCGAGVGVGA